MGYTIFSDSQAAISRVQHGRCGPAQALAKAVIATVDEMDRRGNTLSIRRTPSHEGIEENEQADAMAGTTAEGKEEKASQGYLQEASLSHLTRKVTEAISEATKAWIRDCVGRRHPYRPPPGGKLRKVLARMRKEVASRFYQLLSGHAATAEHLMRVGQAPNSRCWWCGSGERQSQYHLFVKCRRWGPEIRRLWKRVERDCEWGGSRVPSVHFLFRDARATPAVLDFLEDTRVGKMPSRVLLAGGPDVEEEGMEEVALWAPEAEEGPGLGPPP